MYNLARLASSAAAGNEPPVLASVASGVAKVVLNRESKLNALNYPMIELMTPLYEELDADNNVHAIVLRGAGEKAFCAGGDVVSIVNSIKENGDLHRYFFRDEYALDYAIASLKTPHVALYNGIAMGGGIGLSVHGTFRVATDSALFAMPETAIGLFPDVGGTHFLPRLPHGLGMYLALTGARVKGADLVYYGIATHHLDAPEDELYSALAAASSPDAVAAALDDVCSLSRDALDDGARVAAIEASLGGVPVSVVDSVFGQAASYPEVVDSLAALESGADEPAVAKWAAKTSAILAAMSPTSLLVTFEQIKRGGSLTLAESFALEARLVWRVANGHDFAAGVDALLINKTKIAPQDLWSPNTVDAVTRDAVLAHFAPFDDPADELILDPSVNPATI
ncbi:uncharacterized protein AMSG_10188 [Thecamonas trahens ATCC 50062]|uniref:3-hydroxyisobutyryl-CoA hydrolase n=1 Tax=Thecamonas trahens ATCC 50062 TaxID=461836 RepID=A0A0L0DSD4_THETB|nr:hypothetical protein AMSG_10188 [Thecamonas trahens ATCC 50062]KNC54946.1 hypothetical protein AMSG_10188 [Thecamonas trahens ATCC 50062]|eukprot:XP_013753396.1 hypothetical protein AMSG_10188 [Thecamonas trahens ATCC 50062]